MRGNGSFVRRNRSRGWEVTNRLYVGTRTWDGGNESVVRRNRSGRWVVSERLYEERRAKNWRERSGCMVRVGENSIDFLKILYRLFPDTSVEPLGQHGSNDLIVWEHRSVPIVQPLCLLGRKQRDRTRIGEECAQMWVRFVRGVTCEGAQMRGGTHSGMGKRVEWEGLLIRIFAGGGTKKGRGAVASALGCGCWVERVRTRRCSASVGRGLRHVYSPFR